jgi:hypothetical protein
MDHVTIIVLFQCVSSSGSGIYKLTHVVDTVPLSQLVSYDNYIMKFSLYVLSSLFSGFVILMLIYSNYNLTASCAF